jgi:hypothetical protein
MPNVVTRQQQPFMPVIDIVTVYQLGHTSVGQGEGTPHRDGANVLPEAVQDGDASV